MRQKTRQQIREIVCLDISEITEARPLDGAQKMHRTYSLKANKHGKWLLLIFAAALLSVGSGTLGGLRAIFQKIY